MIASQLYYFRFSKIFFWFLGEKSEMKLVKKLSRTQLGCYTLCSGVNFKDEPGRKQNFLTPTLLVRSLEK